MLSERLNEILSSFHISQDEFSKSIGYSPSHISRIIKGEKLPSKRFYQIINQVYNININWIENGEGEMFNISIDNDTKLLNKIKMLNIEEKKAIENLINIMTRK